MNLHDLFEISLERSPGRLAIEFRGTAEEGGGTGEGLGPRAFTYGELLAAADSLAAGLAGWGLGRGERVAVQLGNRPELAVLWLALLRLGAILVPVNPAYRRREVAHILRDAGPRLLVVEGAGRELAAGLTAEERGSVEAVLDAGELGRWTAADGPLARSSGPPAFATRWPGIPSSALPESPPPAPPSGGSAGLPSASPAAPSPGSPPGLSRVFPRVDGSDPAAILYTSGTTGASKGAVLTHDNLLATMAALLAAWGWRADDVLLLALPLIHVHGLIVGLACALAAGATVLLDRRFDAARAVDDLAAGRATLFFGVPTMYVRLVEELRRRPSRPDLSGVRLFCSGSAPLPPETFAAFRELTGHDVLERYGMTEAGMILSNPLAGPRRAGTVGVPLPGVSVRIAAEAGAGEVAAGEVGEVLVRGANVFAGYWRDPAKTAASFRTDPEGRRWLASGDLARRDPETGYVSLLGRRHELILCGGFNVYPREIEEVLLTFPGIQEAAVAGRPDPEWGEVPVAYLVLDAADIPDEALAAFCRERLAGFKQPRAFHRVDSLPRNALGKLQKHLLPR